jgi:hypothetical protein
MKRMLTQLRREDTGHRAVFAAFADGLMRVMRARAGTTRIRAVKL